MIKDLDVVEHPVYGRGTVVHIWDDGVHVLIETEEAVIDVEQNDLTMVWRRDENQT